MNEVNIRKMETDDVEQVIQVEEASFTQPWTPDIFYQETEKNKQAHYFVLEADSKIIGYVGAWIVLDEAQITNIVVLQAYRGLKLGEKLFRFILEYAKTMGVRLLSLEVRQTNLTAQRLYQKLGLQMGGIRKNYYTDNQEDAIVMWVNL